MTSENKLFIGQGYQALYRNVAALAMDGTGVHEGCSPSTSSARAMGVDISSGVVSRQGAIETVGADEIVLSGADDFPRKDVIVWDGGRLQVEEGQPDPVPDEIENAERFETYQPSPPSIEAENWVPICEVHIGADTAEVTSSDINDLRTSPSIRGNLPEGHDLTFGTDDKWSVRAGDEENGLVFEHEDETGRAVLTPDGLDVEGDLKADSFSLDVLRALSQLSFPEYNSTSDAPQEPGVIYIPPDGSDTEGYYKYDPADGVYKLFDEADGQVSSGDLSDLNINTNKSWGGYDLLDIGLVRSERVEITEGYEGLRYNNPDVSPNHSSGAVWKTSWPLITQPTNEGGNQNWIAYDDDGQKRMGAFGFHTHIQDRELDGTGSHWNAYTLDGPVTDDESTIVTRLGIWGGTELADFEVLKTDLFNLEAANARLISPRGNANWILRPETDDSRSQVLFQSATGEDGFRIQHNPGANFGIYNYTTSEYTLRVVEADNTIQFRGNDTEGVVWEDGTTDGRPTDPNRGYRYFDAEIGQPIWYNGTEWVDALGDPV